MNFSKILKIFEIFDVIWGSKSKKFGGLYDKNNVYNGQSIINSNQIILPVQLPKWLTIGKQIRIFKELNNNYDDSILVTVKDIDNNSFQVNETIDDFIGHLRLDSRIAVLTNDPEICQLDKNGSTIFNLDNQKKSTSVKQTALSQQFANHYHEDVLIQKHIITHMLDSTGHKMYYWSEDNNNFMQLGPLPICDNNGNVVYAKTIKKKKNKNMNKLVFLILSIVLLFIISYGKNNNMSNNNQCLDTIESIRQNSNDTPCEDKNITDVKKYCGNHFGCEDIRIMIRNNERH